MKVPIDKKQSKAVPRRRQNKSSHGGGTGREREDREMPLRGLGDAAGTPGRLPSAVWRRLLFALLEGNPHGSCPVPSFLSAVLGIPFSSSEGEGALWRPHTRCPSLLAFPCSRSAFHPLLQRRAGQGGDLSASVPHPRLQGESSPTRFTARGGARPARVPAGTRARGGARSLSQAASETAAKRIRYVNVLSCCEKVSIFNTPFRSRLVRYVGAYDPQCAFPRAHACL